MYTIDIIFIALITILLPFILLLFLLSTYAKNKKSNKGRGFSFWEIDMFNLIKQFNRFKVRDNRANGYVGMINGFMLLFVFLDTWGLAVKDHLLYYIIAWIGIKQLIGYIDDRYKVYDDEETYRASKNKLFEKLENLIAKNNKNNKNDKK